MRTMAIVLCVAVGVFVKPPASRSDPDPTLRRCQDALEGRIAWDAHGSTGWSSVNIDRLCRGERSDEPALCFNRVMHGGINWGGGTQWQWTNAIDLCESTPDALATVSCFVDRIREGHDWGAAISACDERSRGAVQVDVPDGPIVSVPDPTNRPPVQAGEPGGSLVASVPDPSTRPGIQLGDPAETVTIGSVVGPGTMDPLPANRASNRECRDAVQGRIAWDERGSTEWNSVNLDRLCRAAASFQPARCFDRVMHGGINWGGGTQWRWANAIDLCEGTSDAAATIACFERRVAAGQDWQTAISACDERADRSERLHTAPAQ
jgi:hypothetical protein